MASISEVDPSGPTAVNGWGPGQALLALEQELQREGRPVLVLYGWIPDHVKRSYVRRSRVGLMALFDRRQVHFELGPEGPRHLGAVGVADSVPDDAPGLSQLEHRADSGAAADKCGASAASTASVSR